MLWKDIKQRLASLRRVECIQNHRKRKEKEQANFYKNSFKHARQLLEEAKSGNLEMTREEVEEYIRRQYSNPARNEPLGSPGYMPRSALPMSQFNISPPNLSEVGEVVRKARSSYRPQWDSLQAL